MATVSRQDAALAHCKRGRPGAMAPLGSGTTDSAGRLLASAKGLNGLEEVRFEFDGGGLVDEIQAQQNGRHAVPALDPPFDSLQRATLDPHAHAHADGRGQANTNPRVESQQDVLQLLLESTLVEDLKEVGHVIALADRSRLAGKKPQEEIAGKRGFRKTTVLPRYLWAAS